jgi:hypothetical protein
MSTQPASLKQIILAGFLPVIGMIPFEIFLHRDFARFQQLAPIAAATQKVPFTDARLGAAVGGLICVIVGFLLLGFYCLRSSRPRLAALILLAYMIAFFAAVYFTAPSGYWVG